MSVFTFSTFFVSFTSFLLAIFVFSRNRTSIINITWALFSASVGLWSLGYFGFLLVNLKEAGFFWIKVLYWGAIFIPTFCFHFVCVLFGIANKKRILIRLSYCLSIFFALTNFTLYFVADLKPMFNFKWWPVPGLFFPFFVAHFLATLSYGVFLILREYRKAPHRRKIQALYLLLGIGIAFLGGSTNYLSIFGLPIFPFGNLFVIALAGLVTYAIVRHQLLEIEVIIKKTLVFAGIVTSAVCVIALPVALVQTIIGRAIGIPPFWLMITGVATSVLIYRPVDKRLTILTDRYLFQKKINYRLLLKEASEYLAHVDSLKKQTRRIVSFLVKKARIANASVYVFTSRQPNFLILEASRPFNQVGELNRISVIHPIIQCLYKRRSSLELDQLDELKKMEKDPKAYAQLDEIESLLKSLKAEAAVPCFGGQAATQARKTDVHLRGILFLGHQKSDEPYTEEDLDVFFTLAQESSIAFENARLYDEAIQRSNELSRINIELEAAQGELIRALDETERANKELKVTQASLIAAEKKATLVGMAQAIGHEVFNPLSPIMMQAPLLVSRDVKFYSQILEKYRNAMESDDVVKFEKIIQKTDISGKAITRNAKRIEGVVKTLTGTLKESSGEISPRSLSVLIQKTLESARFTTGDENLAGCIIEVSIANNLMVMGNADQLEQVFLNLIKNAYEAMIGRNDRKIEIHGKVDPEDSKTVLIEFIDNGPGIPTDVIAKIWMQGFSTKTRKSDSIGAAGQGQGLFVCKHLIESLHKGSITVRSELGKGTTFIIKLPLA